MQQTLIAKLRFGYVAVESCESEVLVSEHPRSLPISDDHGGVPTYPADLTLTMQAELAALADIDKHYEQRRHNLGNWAGPQ